MKKRVVYGCIGAIIMLFLTAFPVTMGTHTLDTGYVRDGVMDDIDTPVGERSFEDEFCITWVDPEGDAWYVIFNWGDGTVSGWIGPFASGEEACASHIWVDDGVYHIFAKVKDDQGTETPWMYLGTVGSWIQGPSRGRPDVEYTFWIELPVHPEGDQMYALWDWGDGTSEEWRGPYDGGTNASASHAWQQRGQYEIRVKLKDESGEGGWSASRIMLIRWFFSNSYSKYPQFSLLHAFFQFFDNLI
jgi:hypothetical protein